uniref:Ectin-like isoform X1 n=1 Tax=Crassostrea virginica TaxID=6565 RepID=A0A8B8E3R8_CRAVI|nr:ectin-like isoform X1 [Crassostrea virginica]
MAALGYSVWIAVFVISLSLAEKRLILDTFINVQTSYEEWSAWGECTASCGMMGTQQRTRGCHHILVGILTFSHECPVAGKESLFCFGACTQPAATMTSTSLGSWSNWGQFSSCDKSCGGGIQIRRRVCSGGTCIGDSLESASCNNHQCPVKSTTLLPTTRTTASTSTTSQSSSTNSMIYMTIKRR